MGAALVGVIAHWCWDQIIGDLRASTGDAHQSDSSDIRAQRMPTLLKPSPRNLWASLVVREPTPLAGRLSGELDRRAGQRQHGK
jgi:hypothetical protein